MVVFFWLVARGSNPRRVGWLGDFVAVWEKVFHEVNGASFMAITKIVVMDHFQFKRNLGLSLAHSCECCFLLPINRAAIPHSQK